MAVKRGLHSQFLTLANSRAPCGGIRNYPECGKVTVKNPTWRKKKYKMKKKKGTFTYRYLCGHIFISGGHVCRSGIAGLSAKSVFNT